MKALERIEEEDEGEYPDLILYLKQLSGDSSDSKATAESQFTPKVEYQTMEEEQGPVDFENRRKVEEIMKSDNPEEGLRAFMEDVVKNQFLQNPEDPEDNRKRSKTS